MHYCYCGKTPLYSFILHLSCDLMLLLLWLNFLRAISNWKKFSPFFSSFFSIMKVKRNDCFCIHFIWFHFEYSPNIQTFELISLLCNLSEATRLDFRSSRSSSSCCCCWIVLLLLLTLWHGTTAYVFGVVGNINFIFLVLLLFYI